MKQFTQEYLVSDLELRLSKSKPSNELELEYSQMAMWIDQARDAVTSEVLNGAKVIDSSLVLEIKDIAPYEVSGMYFIDLGLLPLNLKNNRGIVYVVDDNGRYLLGQSIQNKRYLSKLAFTKPTDCNIVYSLTGSSLLLEGSESIMDGTYSVGIVHSELSREKDPDERYYILPSTVESVLVIAEEIGLRQMNGDSAYDINNDGIGNNG